MNLNDLFSDLECEYLSRSADIKNRQITSIVTDSREVVKDCLFVCIAGARFDSHDAVAEVAEQGAAAIVVERDVDIPDGVSIVKVPDTRTTLALISAVWFGYPARKLTMIGITGTKGKSTSAYMIRNMLEHCGHKTGIIGTIGVGIGDNTYQTKNTTPDPYTIQSYLAQMVSEGCDCAVMEVSSQAMKQHRVAGIIFDFALFTNLESDHIGEGEHASFEEYMYCKSLLFRQCRFAIGNGDDPHFDDVVRGKALPPEGFTPASAVICNKIETFGCGEGNDYRAIDIELIGSGGHIGVSYTATNNINGNTVKVALSIPGRFNVYNSIGALAVCSHFMRNHSGANEYVYRELMDRALKALYHTHVRGRLEALKVSDRFSIMIDYAHNAMALENLLGTLREHNPARLVCLFGCGGNRAKERRYEMGEVSSRLADLTVVTSDNPRYEKPEDIIEDILVGVKKAGGEYIVIPDRREAISYVLENAQEGDVIVLAGKGQEDYQEINGERFPMDERVIVDEAVKEIVEKRGYI